MGKFTMGLFRRVGRGRELDADLVDLTDWWLGGLVGSRCCEGGEEFVTNFTNWHEFGSTEKLAGRCCAWRG